MPIGCPEERCAVADEFGAEVDAGSRIVTDKIVQPPAPVAQRVAAEVLAVKRDEIEGLENQAMRCRLHGPFERLESVTPASF